MAIENELKFEGGVPSSKLKVPPKSCIPNSAKIKINRKRSNNRDMMDLIELSKEITRFRSEDQYLKWKCLSFFQFEYNLIFSSQINFDLFNLHSDFEYTK